MNNATQESILSPSTVGMGLEDIIRQGARAIIQQAIEAELADLLATFRNVTTLEGRQTVVRNGYLPEREVMTTVGPITVKVPKVRDRSGHGIKFNSALVPPYVRKSKRISAALPWLYLKGISTGDMREALSVMLGDEAKGLSASVVQRLKADWAMAYELWNRRLLNDQEYVYWWADGIYSAIRGNHEKSCLLVIIGVRADGSKEMVALSEGFRESKESWLDMLRDLKLRGLPIGPRLAIGDGALGFWAAMNEAFPDTRHQRCWFHKMGNVLNVLPKSLQSKAKAELQSIWMAPTRDEATKLFDRFLRTYESKYPKATAKLVKDKDALLAFYDFPAKHWQHLRTTNPIESTFATVRHRTSQSRNCFSRSTLLGFAFKLILEAEKTWRKIQGYEQIPSLMRGVVFKDGEPVEDNTPDQQKIAA